MDWKIEHWKQKLENVQKSFVCVCSSVCQRHLCWYSDCLFIHQFVFLSIHLLSMHLLVYVSCLSVCPSNWSVHNSSCPYMLSVNVYVCCLSVCLSFCQSTRLSVVSVVSQSICMSVHLCCLSVHVPVVRLSICLYALSACLLLVLSVYQSVCCSSVYLCCLSLYMCCLSLYMCCLSIHLFVCPSALAACPSVCHNVICAVCPSGCLSSQRLSPCLFVHLSAFISLYPSVYFFICSFVEISQN